MATLYVKRWAGLARSANPSILYLPQKLGGLNLPLISVLFKSLQVARQSLLTSSDPCVRFMAEKGLQHSLALQRSKFRPSVVVREVMMSNPNFSRRSISRGAKLMVREEAIEVSQDHLLSLDKEGHMFRCTSTDAAEIWGESLMCLPDDVRKFALNSAMDTLPHNANLYLWKKRGDNTCPLCGERQTLIHVLNACPVALGAQRYNTRHDAILEVIATTISAHLQPSERISSDLTNYTFPQHITSTTLRPDIVLWDDTKRQLLLLELTVCFETSFN